MFLRLQSMENYDMEAQFQVTFAMMNSESSTECYS